MLNGMLGEQPLTEIEVCEAARSEIDAPFAQQPLADALQMSEVNWHGTLFTVHAGLPHLLRGGHGHVVIVSSGGARAFPSAAVYNGTKPPSACSATRCATSSRARACR